MRMIRCTKGVVKNQIYKEDAFFVSPETISVVEPLDYGCIITLTCGKQFVCTDTMEDVVDAATVTRLMEWGKIL